MNKPELVNKLSSRMTSLSKADAKRIIDALFDADRGIIATELALGGEVKLTGFGTFCTTFREAREGRNPQTGASMTYPAKTSPKFKPGATLKATVNGS